MHEDGLVHDRKLVGVNVIEVTESEGTRIISSAIDIPLSPHGGGDEQVRGLTMVIIYSFHCTCLDTHANAFLEATRKKGGAANCQHMVIFGRFFEEWHLILEWDAWLCSLVMPSINKHCSVSFLH